MWIVKLGGSLAASPHLPLWLEALSQTAAVIVPGGGPFADAVREAQARWHFDEATAHHMAILGMRQYGRMLTGLCPKLLAATTLEELMANPGQAKVWLPLPELLDDAGIPATWDISSDSLAAWLAGQTQAANLLLVKSIAPFASRKSGLQPATGGFRGLKPASTARASLMRTDERMQAPRAISFDRLVNQGWVDPVFPEYAAQSACQSWLCGLDGYVGLTQALADPAHHFVHIIAPQSFNNP